MHTQVIEPNSRVLEEQMKSADTLETLLAHHENFLDSTLKEMMLTSPVLLKVLSVLSDIIFASLCL